MKKIMISLLFFLILGVKQGAVYAADVYACEFEGYEVYVDSNSIQGLRGAQMLVPRIKFIMDGTVLHSAMGTFTYYPRYGTWFGNLLIDGMTVWQAYEYPVESDVLTYAIFETAYQYLP